MARAAEPQFGRVSRVQLEQLGIASGTVVAWCRDGYLHRELPHVYAVGHRARTIESDLASALLYAGPGAALSHVTAAWWLGLVEERPGCIQVTTRRRCRSIRGIRIYDRRERARILHKRLAVTTVPHTLLDLAATAPLRILRLALANAEYRGVLDLESIRQVLTRGQPGTAKLRQGLMSHQPQLARTKSRLERMLVELCEEEHLPIPKINVYVAGWQVDALWQEARVAVELDGYGNHHTPAQLRRDRRKELALRQVGLTPLRYSEEQLVQRTDVADELRSLTGATPAA